MFAVVFDLVQSVAGSGAPEALAALVEDGGELVLMSLIAANRFEICCRAYGGKRYATHMISRTVFTAGRP